MATRLIVWFLGLILMLTLAGPGVITLGLALFVWLPVCLLTSQTTPQPRRR